MPGPDGIIHVAKGMLRPLTVIPAPSPAAAMAAPTSDVLVTLGGGAKFAANVPAPGAGNALNGETVTIAGGGTVGASSVTYSVVPATGVVQGDGIRILPADFTSDHQATLAGDAGGAVRGARTHRTGQALGGVAALDVHRGQQDRATRSHGEGHRVAGRAVIAGTVDREQASGLELFVMRR